jgi:hypothetical protein
MSKIIKFIGLVFLGVVLSFLVDSNLDYFVKLILIGVVVLPINMYQSYEQPHHTDIES